MSKEKNSEGESFKKDTWVFIALVTLSILYLFEVGYTKLSWLNGAAFAIIAVTLIPLLISIIRKISRFVRARKKKQLEKLAAKQAKEAQNGQTAAETSGTPSAN